MIVGTDQSISISGGSGTGALSLTTSTPSACSLSALTVTAIAAGTCTITATKAGDGSYNPASTSTSITVAGVPDQGSSTGGSSESGQSGGSGESSGSSSESGNGSSSSSNTVVPISPTQFIYSGASDSVYYFYVPSMSGNVLVSLSLPAGTTIQPVVISVTPLSSREDVSAGLVIIDVTMRQLSDGAIVSRLAKAIEIRYWTPYIGTIPSLKEPGVIWSPMPLVLTPQLPNLIDAAYFVHSDSTYSVFTRSLSEFSFTRVQEDLLISVSKRSMTVGEKISIGFSGGSGSGRISFVSDDSQICNVDETGIVTALAFGECNVYITKESSSEYLATVSNAVTFTVKESSRERFERTSSRNWLIYKKVDDGYEVKINLARKYSNADATLQVRAYVKGRLMYRTLADIKLNAAGDALFTGSKALLDGTRLRLVMNKSNIKFGTAANNR
jgi:hypothetical protein